MMSKFLIFSINPGRCGSGYLTTLLNYHPEVLSLHEPKPDFAEVMRPGQNNPLLLQKFMLEEKLPWIERQPQKFYVETSHLFGKGFFEALDEISEHYGLIIMTRPPRETAKSLLRIGCVPSRSESGIKYLLSPTDQVHLKISRWEHFSDYQLCYWYAMEMLARSRHYSDLATQKGNPVFKTSIVELRKYSHWRKMLSHLGLPNPTLLGKIKYLRRHRRVINKKQNHSLTKELPETSEIYDDWESEVAESVRES
jgi:hypothetical protein